MEILSTIGSLLSVGEVLLNFKDRLKNKPNKDYIAQWLEHLAGLIESIDEDLKQGRYPHYKCAEMQFYLTAFHDMLKNDIEVNISNKLFELIQESYQVERLLGQLNHLTQEEKGLNHISLLEAAGTFRGISNYIKIKR